MVDAEPPTSDLDPEMLAEIETFGVVRPTEVGEYLFRAGDDSPPFYVVVDGEVDIVRESDESARVLVTHTAGRFLGELHLLTGQRPYLTARVSEAGHVLEVAQPEFRRLMSARPAISDVIFRTFVARRDFLRQGEAAGAIRIVGSRYAPEAMALRAFANRARLPHTWIDLDDVADVPVYLAGLGMHPGDVPAVLTPTARLKRPSVGELAAHLGLTYQPTPGYLSDLVVVGTGPAGLAASVYGASEGLETVSLDAIGVGGQAAASSRIENYVGFPNGISGGDLVAAASIQAIRLGARLNAPCEVAGLRVEDGFLVVALTDGSELPTKAVVVATGASYRRLEVDELERFEGAGVYYAATELEARVCRGAPVVVVGGGNSAGQAAIYLSQQGSHVYLVVRRDGLEATMSHYLITRIEADPRIELLTCTEVKGLHGDGHLEEVTLVDNRTSKRWTTACEGLFCFIGAVPATEWLGTCVALDRDGFVLTDRAVPPDSPHRGAFGDRDPLPFETSAPGVFAVGDVRSGSMKRVAAAVGEGSSAVRSVHDYLATLADPPV